MSVVVAGGVAYAVQQRLVELWWIPASESPNVDVSGWEYEAALPSARVLYVGHSLVGFALPGMADAIAVSRGASYRADSQLLEGGSLRRNWMAGRAALQDAEPVHGVHARDALETGEYDALVLTEAVNLDDHLRWSDPSGYAGRWIELARANRPDVRVYFYETWHHRDRPRTRLGLPRSESWRENLDADLGRWEFIVDEVMRDDPRTRELPIIPGGQAMAALHDAVSAGEVPGTDSMDAFFADGVHPNAEGFYFIALVHVATVLRMDPRGATATVPDHDGSTVEIPADRAAALQAIAWRAVSSYPRSGVRVRPSGG